MTLRATTECDGCGKTVPGEDRKSHQMVDFNVEMYTFRGYSDSRSIIGNHQHVCSSVCADKVLDKLVSDFKKVVAEELVKRPPAFTKET